MAWGEDEFALLGLGQVDVLLPPELFVRTQPKTFFVAMLGGNVGAQPACVRHGLAREWRSSHLDVLLCKEKSQSSGRHS